MIKAELINKKTGDVVSIVRQTEDWTHSLGGVLTIPYSWHSDGYCEESFLAEFSIKWDGCSHFHYYGEDYTEEEEADSYYHECGLNEYYKQFIAKLFAFEVARHYMKDIEHMDDDLFYIGIDRVNILDSYDIKYSELDINSDIWYSNYLEI